MKVLLVVIDLLFAVAEGVSGLMEKRRKPRPFTLRELLDMKRKDAELVRRTQAPTVVIPPPSDRERTKRR